MRMVLARPGVRRADGAENVRQTREAAAGAGLRGDDVLVLPELAGGDLPADAYETAVTGLARDLGCHVVGGSHHRSAGRGTVNTGLVADDGGRVLARYDKAHPYGAERDAGVVPGAASGRFAVGGARVGVLLCADLWYSGLVAELVDGGVDVLVVPAFSVTQWPTPEPARELWRHMAVARAYEFTCCVAVCDWAAGTPYAGLAAAGVSGLADPLPATPGRYFTAAAGPVTVVDVDDRRLAALRANRAARGFGRAG